MAEMKSIVNEIYQMIKEECGFELNEISELVEEKDKKIKRLEKALDKACSKLEEINICPHMTKKEWREWSLKELGLFDEHNN